MPKPNQPWLVMKRPKRGYLTQHLCSAVMIVVAKSKQDAITAAEARQPEFFGPDARYTATTAVRVADGVFELL